MERKKDIPPWGENAIILYRCPVVGRYREHCCPQPWSQTQDHWCCRAVPHTWKEERWVEGCPPDKPCGFRDIAVHSFLLNGKVLVANSPIMFCYDKNMLSAPSFFPGIKGAGHIFETAKRNWEEQFSKKFFDLYSTPACLFTAEEKADWDLIKTHLDVSSFALKEHLTRTSRGQIARARPRPSVIRWDSRQTEAIPAALDKHFVGMKVGQRFEVVLERDPVTERVAKVLKLELLEPLGLPENLHNDII